MGGDRLLSKVMWTTRTASGLHHGLGRSMGFVLRHVEPRRARVSRGPRCFFVPSLPAPLHLLTVSQFNDYIDC